MQVLAVESIADELVANVVKAVDGLSVGKPEVGHDAWVSFHPQHKLQTLLALTESIPSTVQCCSHSVSVIAWGQHIILPASSITAGGRDTGCCMRQVVMQRMH